MLSDNTLKWVAFGTFLEWGAIHVAAMAMILKNTAKDDVGGALLGICEAAPEEEITRVKNTKSWSPLNVRIMIQHGLNLGFAGFASLACSAWFTFYKVPRHAFYLGLWPWFADVAYFIAVDTVQYGAVIPQAQTYIISTALISTAIRVSRQYDDVSGKEAHLTVLVPSLLIVAAILHKTYHFFVGSTKSTKKD